MMRPRTKRSWRWLLIILGALVLGFFGIQAWLSSGIGRGAVETRLSSALGRPARLEGDFSLRLLPRPGISGSALRIFTTDGRWLVLDAGDYLARVALFPLFRGDIQVLALEFANAQADLGRLLEEPRADTGSDEINLALPDIHSFGLMDVSLYFDGMGSEPYLLIEELVVDNFTLDTPAHFALGLQMVSEGEARLRTFGTGNITVRSGGVVETAFSRLDLGIEGWDVRGLAGGLRLDFSSSMLGANLEWGDPDQQVRMGANINLEPPFAREAPGYAIEAFEFVLNSQEIAGSGCLLRAATPELHMLLEATALDVEGMATLLQKWQVPEPSVADPLTGVEPADLEPAGEDAELPFDLAIVLEIQRATYGDAVAEGATLRIGAAPGCPAAP